MAGDQRFRADGRWRAGSLGPIVATARQLTTLRHAADEPTRLQAAPKLREQDGLRPGLAVTAPLPQICLRLPAIGPYLTSRLSQTTEPNSAPQSHISALPFLAANGVRTRDLKLAPLEALRRFFAGSGRLGSVTRDEHSHGQSGQVQARLASRHRREPLPMSAQHEQAVRVAADYGRTGRVLPPRRPPLAAADVMSASEVAELMHVSKSTVEDWGAARHCPVQEGGPT